MATEKWVRRNNATLWECVCDCGTVKLVYAYILRKGVHISCKCRLGTELEKGAYGPKMLPKDVIRERYESKVVKGKDCWQWTAAKTAHGYGIMSVSFGRPTRLTRAHRISWFLHHGWWAGGDLEVCHRCNNPACSNPEHLYVATHAVNIRHARRDGIIGGNEGAKNGSNCRLTEEQVLKIKAVTKRGELTKLSKLYNISQTHISNIRGGRKWKHLL